MGRLTNSPIRHESIRELVVNALQTVDVTSTEGSVSVTRHQFQLSNTPFAAGSRGEFNASQAGSFLSSQYSIASRELMTLVRPGRAAIIVALDSVKKDHKLKGIARQLRDSAKSQFSKVRPGILVVQIYGLISSEFDQLVYESGARADHRSGLDFIAKELIRGDSTRHMLSILFRSHGHVHSRTKTTARMRVRTTGAVGSTYVCTKLAHPLSQNRDVNPFLGASVKRRSR
jgi:hypothetical protein